MKETRLISETPDDLRPYEKCEALGAEALSDPELLAVIIKSGAAGLSSVALAEQLLYPDGRRLGLNKLFRLSLEEFREHRGIGRVKAIQLACIAELGKRLSEERAEAALDVSIPARIADYYMQRLRTLAEEEVHVMLLDTHRQFLRSVCVSRGTVNSSSISPREIFIAALSSRAAAFVMIHNHPSGDPDPSTQDIRFARILKDLGLMMNIHMTDSIIIGDNRFCSLMEQNLL